MAIWSVGSISNHITNMVGPSNVPDSVSGTTMNNIVIQQINRAEEFTKQTIGITAIEAKFQPPLIDLSMAQLLRSMEMNEGGINSARLGELSASEGGGIVAGKLGTAIQLEKEGLSKLRLLGRDVKFRRVIGGRGR